MTVTSKMLGRFIRAGQRTCGCCDDKRPKGSFRQIEKREWRRTWDGWR